MQATSPVAVHKNKYKTAIFTVIVIVTNVLGNFALTVGMRRVGSLISRSPLAYIQALVDPFVALGVALLIAWMISHMFLLSWADLSYVLPVTSLGYVLVALIGHFLLDEDVSDSHWTGIVLIVLGVFLVGRTAARTARTS
ncbi:MAG: EamA family transporter [Bryobacteraceae bacterium]